jgi:signal transduction histidine kinase
MPIPLSFPNGPHQAVPHLTEFPPPIWGTTHGNIGGGWGISKHADAATNIAVGDRYDACCSARWACLRGGPRSTRLTTMATGGSKTSGRVIAFELAVILPTFVIGAALVAANPEAFSKDGIKTGGPLALWAVLIGLVELLPVPTWRGLTISVGFPLLMVVAFLYPPAAAAAVALVGASDPRELRGEVSFLRALFNRSQVALSVLVAGSIFHGLTDFRVDHTEVDFVVVVAAAAASLADYVVNSGLVTVFVSLRTGEPIRQVARELRIGRLSEFLLSYLGLGLVGLSLAALFDRVGPVTLPAILAPLLFARQMFFRSQALAEAHKELQDREQVLRSLSNAMAEERADERLQIAGYLHDDLAQVLFRLSIQVDVARKLLEKGQLGDVGDQLDKIRESKQETSDRIRALIRDLHRSPLGARGLAEALESFTDEVGRDSSIRFHRDVEDIQLPAPIALLVYHIAREGVMNALKHAQPRDVWIAVREEGEDIVLSLRDNGVGFDTSAPGPEGHFGMAMMRERAQVGGGRFEVESAPGQGASITVRFPTSLLLEESGAEEPDDRSAPPAEGASPGIPGTTEPAADGSRRTVPA